MGVLALAEESARVDPPKSNAAQRALDNNLQKLKDMAAQMAQKEKDMLHGLAAIPGAPKDFQQEVDNFNAKSHESLMEERTKLREQLIHEAHQYRNGHMNNESL